MPQYSFKPILQLPKKFVIEEDTLVPIANSFSYPSNHGSGSYRICFYRKFSIISEVKDSRNIYLVVSNQYWSYQVYTITALFYRYYCWFHFRLHHISSFKQSYEIDQPFLMSKFKGKDQDSKTLR